MKPKIARRWLRKMQWKIARHNIGISSLSSSEVKMYKKCIRSLVKDE